MSAGAYRKPVLSPEEETELRKQLEKLWYSPLNLSAPAIAERLGFGVRGSRWEKLKPYHIYFYRSKFGLEPRRPEESLKRKGKPRYKVKQKDTMPIDVFIKTLNEKLPPTSKVNRQKRAYLILHYWTPLRKSEILERSIDDFIVDQEGRLLTINLVRKKKGAAEPEPLDVPLDFPLMNEVVAWLENKEWVTMSNKDKPFNFSHTKAWQTVKEVFGNYYPHFFRFNYITDRLDDVDATIPEIKSATGLSLPAIERYVMASRRAQRRMEERKLQKIKKKMGETEG